VKRSFLELPVDIDVEALRSDVAGLPSQAWTDSYWPTVHGSVQLVLLRGGITKSKSDFLCTHVIDHPVLQTVPHFRSLIARDGPFGGCRYAFLFRMEAGGMATMHTDARQVWTTHHRIHVPIHTSPEAVLVVSGRGCHFAPGRAWTFDNQAPHGFANGPVERIHLIIDVAPNPSLDPLLEQAQFHEGTDATELCKRIANDDNFNPDEW